MYLISALWGGSLIGWAVPMLSSGTIEVVIPKDLIIQRNIISENDISKAHEPSVIALKGQNIIAQGNALGKKTPAIFLAL